MSIRKHLKLILLFTKLQIMDRFDMPLTFFLVLLGSIARIAINLIFFQAIFLKVPTLAGWDLNQMYILTGTFSLINSLGWISFIRGFSKLPRFIEQGDLDIILTKPVSTRFYLATRWSDIIFTLPIALTSLAVVIYGALHSSMPIDWLSYLITLLFGLIIYLSIVSIIHTFNFFWILPQTVNLQDEISKLGRYPLGIYRGTVKLILSIIIPVCVAITLPSKALFSGLSLNEFFFLIIITLIFYFGGKWFWSFGLKHYQSANG